MSLTGVYKENILDIIDKWDGYPLKDPCSESPALHAGVVELKCFINNNCPFYSSNHMEDGLVFNHRTFEVIKPWLPDSHRNVLTTTRGMQGLHFRPKYVFRNNYIRELDEEAVAGANISEDLLLAEYNLYFKDIVSNSTTSYIIGADETKYMLEQTWLVVSSFFDQSLGATAVNECWPKAKWMYIHQPLSSTAISPESDLKYDYKQAYYQEYLSSLTWDVNSQTFVLKEGEETRILPQQFQMPTQYRTKDEHGHGIHWRLKKATPLFKGEDFFIRFYKQSDTSAVDPTIVNSPPFVNRNYAPLDITATDPVEMVQGFSRATNYAISPPGVGNRQRDIKSFDFYSQAYYIIELGHNTEDSRYCIIIAERAKPMFVHFVKGIDGTVSKELATFEDITGNELINLKYFDITVRNHLGSLVIQFDGPGINVNPWIIRRRDWAIDWDPVAKEPILKDKITPIFVPFGEMVLAGGNIRAGFCFGPLQYRAGYISFVYPPREMAETETPEIAFTFGDPVQISADDMKGAFTSNPFFLPTQGDHHILFSSTDIFLDDLGKHVIPVGEPEVNQPLFVQDAQFYKEYNEEDGSVALDDYTYGAFFYTHTIRDFPAQDGVAHYKTSNLVAKKYRYLNDPKTRHTAFDVLLGMMAGDHMFTNGTSSGAREVSDDMIENAWWDVDDNTWFVPDCKTPIMTSIRLVADHSEETRWEDGTTSAGGIAFTPLNNVSPYFIDATDNVLTFSDSWSTSSFSEMEHTGTIQFYLNRELHVENNVTDSLLALQNRTFYVEIWVGYQSCSFPKVEGFYKLFTGLCHGGKIDYQYGKNIMSCKVQDYTAILKGTRFFNSPWFDGVKDINAIYEIMQMCGFREEGKYDPGSLVRSLSDYTKGVNPGVFFHHFDGRLFKMEPYALPSAYNRLEQPKYKFKDGDPYMNAVAEISKKAGKIFFFDQMGIAHYEDFQDIIEKDYLGLIPIVPLYHFTINPEKYPGQLVFKKVERNYEVENIVNHIKIMSNTPDMHLLIRDHLNYESVENPDTEGFLGYLKTLYQQESMFGSKEALLASIRKYTVMFRPKINIKFETYGVPLRANDIIQINGENCRVIKVTNSINAEKNQWWMEVECMRYQPVQPSMIASGGATTSGTSGT